MRVCHHCGRELQIFSAKVERTASCPYCRSDLKCCLNCRLHDPGANNQCREPQAEWQGDKDKAVTRYQAAWTKRPNDPRVKQRLTNLGKPPA